MARSHACASVSGCAFDACESTPLLEEEKEEENRRQFDNFDHGKNCVAPGEASEPALEEASHHRNRHMSRGTRVSRSETAPKPFPAKTVWLGWAPLQPGHAQMESDVGVRRDM
ncbi:hypothetical protein N658DRAFT_496608 [Parathielavia hyrcaniae]|uniref:Uncharacterized protein n=1 Tax=Parathielavia hyrcaniae TaxID=113614 RepID=A0AAN6Q0G4_9PEZI|nr:hypothetical protein N658DRAFT_496608 [Parathielavia hyrcaniae]